MKFRHLLTGVAFTVCLLFSLSLTAFAAVPTGRFDAVTDSAISGWAYDSSSPDDALNVRILIKNKETEEVILDQKLSAGEYRDNLYESGRGNGCHGFTIDVDWSAYPAGEYIIEGSVGDRDFSNPKTYKNGEAAETEAATGNNEAAETADGDLAAHLIPLGVFKTTGYCPCRACSEGWGRNTRTGAIATASHTVAVDPRTIPYGSKLMINGVIYTAEDCGGGVRGNHIDIFFDSHSVAKQHGVQNAEVYLVLPA